MAKTLHSDLQQALGLFGRVTKLVVSDEYPPFTTGGAEISLHELLTHEDSKSQTLIVKFTNPRSVIRYYRYEGVHVLELPASNIWRLSGTPLFELTEKRHGLPNPISKVIRGVWDAGRWFHFLLKSGLKRNHLAVALLQLGRPPLGGVLMDSIEEQYALRADLLNLIAERLRPETLIANNTRSIVASYYARKRSPNTWESIRTIAMVRDNRFACPRYNQIMRVGGNDCNECRYTCAGEDAALFKGLQKHLLEKTAETRKSALASFDAVTVTSQFLRQQISELLTDKTELHLVPNFVRPPEHLVPEIPERSAGGTDTLVVIGSLNGAKGQLEFIQNSLDHLKLHPQVRISIVGKGDRLQKRIERMLHAAGLLDRVTFTGFLDREALFEVIGSASIVVLPTLWPEPFGRVPLEAGLCRRPVVSFKSGGMVESIVDGETGYLVDKENYEDLWHRIVDLLQDKSKQRRMGEAGFQQVNKRYTAQRTLDALQGAQYPKH